MRDEADQLQFPALALMTAQELEKTIFAAGAITRRLDEGIHLLTDSVTMLGTIRERVQNTELDGKAYLKKLSEGPAVKPYVNGVTTGIDQPPVAAAPPTERVRPTKKTGNRAMILWKVWGAKKGIPFDDLVAQVHTELPDNVLDSIRQQVLAMAKVGSISRDKYGQQLIGWPEGKAAPPKPKKLLIK